MSQKSFQARVSGLDASVSRACNSVFGVVSSKAYSLPNLKHCMQILHSFFHNYHNHISGIYVLGCASSLQHLLVAFPRLCSCATPHPSSQMSQSVVLRWTTCRPRCLVVQYMCTHSFQQCNNFLLPIREFFAKEIKSLVEANQDQFLLICVV